MLHSSLVFEKGMLKAICVMGRLCLRLSSCSMRQVPRSPGKLQRRRGQRQSKLTSVVGKFHTTLKINCGLWHVNHCPRKVQRKHGKSPEVDNVNVFAPHSSDMHAVFRQPMRSNSARHANYISKVSILASYQSNNWSDK